MQCYYLFGRRPRQIACAINATPSAPAAIDIPTSGGGSGSGLSSLASMAVLGVSLLFFAPRLAPSVTRRGLLSHDAQQFSADASSHRLVVRGLEQFLDCACATGDVVRHTGEFDLASLQTPRELQSESSRNRAVIFRKVVA